MFFFVFLKIFVEDLFLSVRNSLEIPREFWEVQANKPRIFPELIAQHPGKRIGLFIDGPKEMLAVKLCIQSLKASNSIQYCIFHDMVKKKKNPAYQKTLKYLRSWHRLVGLCCCDQRWVTALGGPASMGIVAGSAIIPFGPGDTIPE